jgi:hypothetical protein
MSLQTFRIPLKYPLKSIRMPLKSALPETNMIKNIPQVTNVNSNHSMKSETVTRL